MKKPSHLCVLMVCAAAGAASAETPMGTAFTYQGRLTDVGVPPTGTYDLRFSLHDALTGGSPVGAAIVKDDVSVAAGLFTVALDFGASAFPGTARWIEIGVRPGSENGAFTTLVPRQELTPTPAALQLRDLPGRLSYGRAASTPGQSCADIKAQAPWSEDGIYLVDPDGTGALTVQRVRCDMTRDGGGWTLVLKNRYVSGMHGRADGFGSVDDLEAHQSDFYKLADATINAVVGDGTFDLLVDQAGYNSAYSSGNHEYVIVRNYTATFSFTTLVPESSSTTVFESYRATDDLLVWRGRLGCGSVGGVGVNCEPVLSTPSPVGSANPQGGSGCLVPLGTASNASWHHLYMSNTNSDTYLYICNGAQHSSSYDMSHRWWVR